MTVENVSYKCISIIDPKIVIVYLNGSILICLHCQCLLMGFLGGATKTRLSRLTHLFALSVGTVYRNRIAVKNINK